MKKEFIFTIFILGILILVTFTGCSPYPKFNKYEQGGIQKGYASWYGSKFNGQKTASGEIYDMNQLTAAHRYLAFGRVVKVTNLKNGKSVTVRINDRGPFVNKRIIDLSKAAALELDMTSDGVVMVELVIIK